MELLTRRNEIQNSSQVRSFEITEIIGEREYLIEELPSFYDFLGYMYYCGGTIAGPFFEYKDYIQFIQRTGHYSNIPSTIMATLRRFSHAVCKRSDFDPFSFHCHDGDSR
jgi:hypothetical protein